MESQGNVEEEPNQAVPEDSKETRQDSSHQNGASVHSPMAREEEHGTDMRTQQRETLPGSATSGLPPPEGRNQSVNTSLAAPTSRSDGRSGQSSPTSGSAFPAAQSSQSDGRSGQSAPASRNASAVAGNDSPSGERSSRSQSPVSGSSSTTPIEQLIKEAKLLVEVRKTDTEGKVISEDAQSPTWSWQQQRPVNSDSDCGPLRNVIREVFGEVSVTDDDLDVLRQAISLAACVGNQKFVARWCDLTSPIFFGLNKHADWRLREKFCSFIYDTCRDSNLSPLHYVLLRGDSYLMRTILPYMTYATDDECFRRIYWRPKTGLAKGCSAGVVLSIGNQEVDIRYLSWRYVANLEEIFPGNEEKHFTTSLLCNEEIPNDSEVLSALHCVSISFFGSLELTTILNYWYPDFVPQMKEKTKYRKTLLNRPTTVHYLTPLQVAVIAGNKASVVQLLKLHQIYELNISSADCGKRTVLHWAVYEKHKEIVELLVDYARQSKQPLYAADEDEHQLTPVEIALDTAHVDSDMEEIGKLLVRIPDIERQIDKLYRDRQVYVDSANAILVGAALIASVTFASWMQPPLGYIQYEQYPVGGEIPDQYKSFAALEQELRVRIFWVFNCLSFFFAMATVLTGAGSVLPRNDLFISAAVRSLKRWLMVTSAFLSISIMCGLGAFTAAGFAAMPPILSLEVHMIVPAVLGTFVCLTVMVFYVLRLVKVLMAQYRTQQKKNVTSRCGRDKIKRFVKQAQRKLKDLELLRLEVTSERLAYLHSVAVQIDGQLKEELEGPNPPSMDEMDKKYNRVLASRLQSCIGYREEDVNCNVIEVRGGSFCFTRKAPHEMTGKGVFEYFKIKRLEADDKILKFREKLKKEKIKNVHYSS